MIGLVTGSQCSSTWTIFDNDRQPRNRHATSRHKSKTIWRRNSAAGRLGWRSAQWAAGIMSTQTTCKNCGSRLTCRRNRRSWDRKTCTSNRVQCCWWWTRDKQWLAELRRPNMTEGQEKKVMHTREQAWTSSGTCPKGVKALITTICKNAHPLCIRSGMSQSTCFKNLVITISDITRLFAYLVKSRPKG